MGYIKYIRRVTATIADGREALETSINKEELPLAAFLDQKDIEELSLPSHPGLISSILLGIQDAEGMNAYIGTLDDKGLVMLDTTFLLVLLGRGVPIIYEDERTEVMTPIKDVNMNSDVHRLVLTNGVTFPPEEIIMGLYDIFQQQRANKTGCSKEIQAGSGKAQMIKAIPGPIGKGGNV